MLKEKYLYESAFLAVLSARMHRNENTEEVQVSSKVPAE